MQLGQIYDNIAGEMDEVRELFDKELDCENSLISEMLNQVGKFHGKMLRPVLVLLCGKACGGIRRQHHIIAAVMEMVHMASLIHDDVLDEADFRRRRPTINTLHGNEAAVILGDFLISHAFHLCSSLDAPPVSRLIAAATNTACEGELMQLYHRGDYNLTEGQYFEIITRKTASLIALCCYLGGQVAGMDEVTCQSLRRFGLNLGIAFQIMDDVMDLLGDENAVGKTLGTDVALAKITLPGIHFLSSCSVSESQCLQKRQRGRLNDVQDEAPSRRNQKGLRAFGEDQGRQKLSEMLNRTGSIDYAHRRAVEYTVRAKQNLPELTQPESRDVLLDLASQIIT